MEETARRETAPRIRGHRSMAFAQVDVTLDRPLPQSPDAERAVLGSILINNNAFYRVVSSIGAEDFFRDAHRLIFSAMHKLADIMGHER